MRKLKNSPALLISIVALIASLGGTAVAATSIGTNQIRNGAVTNPKLADNAVNSAKIADASITAGDVAPGTFLGAGDTASNSAQLGGKPAGAFVQGTGILASNRVAIAQGTTTSLLSTGFGHFEGHCNAGGVPVVGYVSDVSAVNLTEWGNSYGSPHGNADVHTANGVGNGNEYLQGSGSLLPFGLTWQLATTDGKVATAWTTGQDIGGNSCIFTAQALSTQ